MRKIQSSLILLLLCFFQGLAKGQTQFSMPPEEAAHEGTWLQWPHDYTYGWGAEELETSWVNMVEALSPSERVHIIVYNATIQSHVEELLDLSSADLDEVDYWICPNDDFWVRDNGPIFVESEAGNWVVLDWGFNGWGGDAPYLLDDAVPGVVGDALGLETIDLSTMVLEGGAIEIDGNGTLAATRSAVTEADRNPSLTESEIESYLSQYLGVDHFIWLDGQYGGQEDITDQHIDAFFRFAGPNRVVTMSDADLAYWYVSASDRAIINEAANADGVPYERIELPLTTNNVQTTWGENVGFRGSYVNYYVANGVVLMPSYDDPMDEVAQQILQSVYPNRSVVGINCQNMLLYGGMVHCVTQQQPAGSGTLSIEIPEGLESESSQFIGYRDLLGRSIDYPEPGKLFLKLFDNGKVEQGISW